MARIGIEPFRRALVVEGPHSSLDGMLRDGGIEAVRVDRVPSDAALIDALRASGAQVLYKRSQVPVSREVLSACPGLFAIQLCCIGSDSIDLAAAAEHGVMVFNDPVSNGRSVVEMAVGHLIALSRRLYETGNETRQGVWKKNAAGRFEVRGKTLGVVGLGNIGRQVARVCEMLGMEVAFYDTRLVAREVGEEMGWRCAATLENLFRTSDMVTIHTSAKDVRGVCNDGMLNSVLMQLAAERPEPSPRVFLNLARGNLFAPEALIAAVREQRVRRAAVDVYPEEPAPGESGWPNPYASEPRITCTPHIGAATQEAQPRIARRVAATSLAFSRRGDVRDCVFAPRTRMSLSDQEGARAVLAVVHSVSRGTKKALDDAIYEAGASNLGSTHRDFPVGVAYDLARIDTPLNAAAIDALVTRAAELSGDQSAVRSVRQLVLPA
jgi:D-3-phosphoglycerate dehydrogenase / 2-oxoglutarate reductase